MFAVLVVRVHHVVLTRSFKLFKFFYILYLLFYGRGLGTVMQADYIDFVFKFRNFRYRGHHVYFLQFYACLYSVLL